jgi:hypothetical protein
VGDSEGGGKICFGGEQNMTVLGERAGGSREGCSRWGLINNSPLARGLTSLCSNVCLMSVKNQVSFLIIYACLWDCCNFKV